MTEDEATHRVSLNVPDHLHRELLAVAERQNLTLCEAVRLLLYRAVVMERPG